MLEGRDPGRAAALRKEVERRARQEGSRWSISWLEAQRAVLEKRWDDALRHFEAAAGESDIDGELYAGHLVDTLLQRGVTRLKLGRPIEALPDFGEARRALPARIEPRVLVAKALYLAGRPLAAEAELELAHRESRQDAARGDEVAIAAAALHREQGDLEEALGWIAKLSEGAATTRLLHTVDLLLLRDDTEAAWQAARQAYDREPRNPETSFALGNVLFQRGEMAEARKQYGEARALAPADPRPCLGVAACFEREGILEEARGVLEAAVRLDPTYAVAHGELGRLQGLMGDLDAAEKSCLVAIELAPDDPVTANNLGTIRDARGDRQGAKMQYERAIAQAPDFAYAHYNLGWTLHRERRFDEARTEYEAALDHGLDDGLVYSNLAPCLHHLKDLPGAIAAYEAAIERDFDDSALHHNYATALAAVPRYAEAVEHFEAAIARQPQGLHTYLYLGQVYEEMGAPAENAESAYRRALDLDSAFLPAQERLARLVLRSGRPPPEGEALRAEIARLEAAAVAGPPRGPVSWLLDAYRRALAPGVASCASVDDLFDGPHDLVSDESTWHFLWSGGPPAQRWTELDFPDADWEEGRDVYLRPAVSGFTAADESQTPEDEGLLLLRARFAIVDPLSLHEVVLKVRSDAAFAVHVNGTEVYRRGSAEAAGGSSERDLATYDFWWVEEVVLDPGILHSGANVVAICAWRTGLTTRQVQLRARLEAGPAPADAIVERAERARSELVASGREEDQALRHYVEGRLAVLAGSPAQGLFEQALALDRSRPEPYLRLAEELARRGDPAAAEERLRGALESGLESHESLWDLWLRLQLVDPAQHPAQVLAAHRALAPATWAMSRPQQDVRWLLERLAAREPLRIKCGGKDGKALGVEWSRDRFYLGGDGGVYLEKLDAARHRIDAFLDKTERYFPATASWIPGYCIPLPPGTYRVSLRITEGFHEEPDRRRFDVLLEGGTFLKDHSPPFGVSEIHSREIFVPDGALEIGFRRRKGSPKISAIEVIGVESR
jgi:tetratricopeptide (TPR) repeat protein